MKAPQFALWHSWPQRRRRVAACLLIVAAAAVYALSIRHFEHERTQLRASVARLTAEANLLEQRALEIERLRTASEPASSTRALREIVESEARAAGLAQNGYTLTAAGEEEVRVVIASIEFAAWLAWVERLQVQRIRLESCSIESLSRPGLVSANAVFVRGR